MPQTAAKTTVDPTELTEVCAFCKKPLDGLPHEGETHYAISSYTPCPTCKAEQDSGITIIEVALEPQGDDQPAINARGDRFPTGSWWVIPEAEFSRVFADEPEALAGGLKSRGIFINPRQAYDLGLYGDHLTQVDADGNPVEEGD